MVFFFQGCDSFSLDCRYRPRRAARVSRIETASAANSIVTDRPTDRPTDTHSDMFRRLSTEEPFVDKDRSYKEMSEAFTALGTTTTTMNDDDNDDDDDDDVEEDLPRRKSFRRRIPTYATSESSSCYKNSFPKSEE